MVVAYHPGIRMPFVNRTHELRLLDEWHAQRGARLGIVWGRRRVGKTFLLTHWAKKHRAVFHVARVNGG